MDSKHGTTHITPAGGNIFLDLGFPPEEAAALKAESDRIINESWAKWGIRIFRWLANQD